MANKYEEQLNALRGKSEALYSKLEQSPTALGGETSPTAGELSTQVQYDALQKQMLGIRKKAQTEHWYGPQTSNAPSDATTEGGKAPGLVTKALDVLSRPLYGVEGAVAHTLGKGTGTDVWKSMAQNISVDKRTFGDLLKSSSVPYPIAAPLGFALDVAFDPVNWATAGTTALIPRLAKGVAKGAVEEGAVGAARGLGLAAKSGLLNKAVFAEKYIPLPGQSTEWYKAKLGGMQKAAVSSTEQYNKLIGKDINQLVGKYGVPTTKGKLPTLSPFGGSKYRASLGEMIQIAAETNPLTAQMFKAMNYSNKDWMRLARIKDSMQNSLGISGGTFNNAMKAYEEGKPIDEFLAEAKAGIEATPKGDTMINWGDNAVSLPDQNIDNVIKQLSGSMSGIADPKKAISLANDMEDAATIMHSPDMAVTLDPIENAMRIASEEVGGTVTLDDIKKLVNQPGMEETGLKWYDNTVNAINNLKYTAKTKNGDKTYAVGKNALEGYQAFINIFKRAKVGASPSSWMNSILGNPTMAWMAGINIFDKQYVKRLSDSAKVAMGSKDSDLVLQEFFENAEIARIMKEMPTAFSRTTGMNPQYTSMKYMVAKALRSASDAGISTKGVDKTQLAEELSKELEDIMSSVLTSDDILSAHTAISKTAGDIAKGGIDSPMKMAQQMLKEGGISTADLPTSLVANEFLESKLATKIFERIREKAEAPNATFAQKAMNTMFNKSIDAYDHIDQSYKNATIMYATKDGFTEGELHKIRRFVQLEPEDVLAPVKDGGVIRYRISGEKALELANETFLNYNAMPAMIKALRNMPIVGSPFASFMYGMLLKTANTAAYNPAVFNKISSGLNDFGGEKTPLEKKALKGKYYSYLDTPSMFRLPWAEQNPLYLNVANMIPYYSFNMFNPSERKYADLYPDKLVNLIDSTPFMKDPVGSVIFDYLIQPMILKESIPVGSFNQPLYPYDANFGTKSLYAMRQLGESVVPGVLAPLGAIVPSDYAEMLPSYGMRKFSNAVAGQNPQGIPTAEPKWSRLSRAVGGYAGLPVQSPVNLTYQSKNQ